MHGVPHGDPDAEAAPLDDPTVAPAFERLLAGLERIGIAVSGGPDSTALLLLLTRWAAALPTPPRLHVLTLDHGLRRGSDREAAGVVALAAELGHGASLLTWRHEGPPPSSGIQDAARRARYRLLADEAHRLSLDAVALGHTRDDQAETFLMRLARGSGVWGLAGMPAERTVHGMRFVRPLLDLPKARLVATLAAAGRTAVEDPANGADRFLRARIRRLSPDLAAVGLDAARLAGTARRLARAAAALDVQVEALERAALTDHGGVLSIALPPLLDAPDEVGLRLLARSIGRIRPHDYLPRAAPIEAFHARLRTDPRALRRLTAAGTVLDRRRDRLWIYAEAGRRGFPTLEIATPGRFVWDDRWTVTVTGAPPPLVVSAATGAERRGDLLPAAAASLPVVRSAGEALREGPNEIGGHRFDLAIHAVTEPRDRSAVPPG